MEINLSLISSLSIANFHKKKRKFILKALSYKIREKMIYYLSKVRQCQSSTTYLSNRTTSITFFLVRMEKLPVSDVWMGQVSYPAISSRDDYQIQSSGNCLTFIDKQTSNEN